MMGKNEIIMLFYGILCSVLLGQNIASGNIGNRSYSSWYETHFLIEKKGIFKLIYYKPKHFGRYTLYETVCFFASFLLPVIFAVSAGLLAAGIISGVIFYGMILIPTSLLFFSQLIIVIINDIGSHRDEKKRFYLESGKRERAGEIDASDLEIKDKNSKLIKQVLAFGLQTRNNAYFTIHNLWDSYHRRMRKACNDAEKMEKINQEYIGYFKNIDNLIVVKENKDGTLVFKQ